VVVGVEDRNVKASHVRSLLSWGLEARPGIG